MVIYFFVLFVDESMFVVDMRWFEWEKFDWFKVMFESGVFKLKLIVFGVDNLSYGVWEGLFYCVFFMRDVNIDELFKYGFVEFWILEDVMVVFVKFNMVCLFNVVGCVVIIVIIYMGVFLFEDRELDEYVEW